MPGMQQTPKSEISPAFTTWVERYMRSHKLSKAKLAEAAHIHVQTLSRVLQGGQMRVEMQTFVGLANAMNMELGYVLHRAGFDIDPNGVNMPRLQRTEAIADAFGEIKDDCRSALAEMAVLLDDTESSVPPVDIEMLRERITSALAKLDVATSRLRDEGYLADIPKEIAASERSNTPKLRSHWSEDEDAVLLHNPTMPHTELAVMLHRSPDAIRVRRMRLAREGITN